MRTITKYLLTLLVFGLVTVGCRESENGAYKHRLNQTNAVKPIKELTKEDIVGEYEITIDGTTMREVFLENGIVESYGNGKLTAEGKWKIVDGEIHVKDDPGDISVQRINIDGSITLIAVIVKDRESRERLELPRYGQITYKKIK